MSNIEIVDVLKRAKQIFMDHPEYWGMCHCIGLAYENKKRGSVLCAYPFLAHIIPKFNREFLNAPKNRIGRAYWWETGTEEGNNLRIKAFDKLIEYYETAE